MSDVRLPDFPRHWLAVAGDDPTNPQAHDHDLCDKIESAITCLFSGGYRFMGGGPLTIVDGNKGMERGR